MFEILHSLFSLEKSSQTSHNHLSHSLISQKNINLLISFENWTI